MHPISVTAVLSFIAIGIIGILIHQVLTIRKLRRRSEKLIIEVNLSNYLHNEWDNMALSFLAVVVAAVAYNEIIAHATDYAIAKWALNFPILFFVAVGMAGDSAIMSVNGKTERLINEEIGSIATKIQQPEPENPL